MAEPDVVLARIVITRILNGDNIIDRVSAQSSDDSDLGLADALGMMRLAEHTLIESYDE